MGLGRLLNADLFPFRPSGTRVPSLMERPLGNIKTSSTSKRKLGTSGQNRNLKGTTGGPYAALCLASTQCLVVFFQSGFIDTSVPQLLSRPVLGVLQHQLAQCPVGT